MSEILGTLFKYLVSLLGVSAVVLILYSVFGANKTQSALSDLSLLQTNTQALYNGQNNFTSLTTAVAIAGKLAPAGMISGATLINPWAGVVTIAVNGGSPSQFDVTEPAVPADACAKLATSLSTLVGLKVNGAAQAVPMEAGAATAACSAAANTLIFTFSR